MECGGKIYFGNKNLNEEEVIMKNKKKNVFLAGLMVLMMIVSLLSGMNLSVAKAAEISANENVENRDIAVYIGWSKTKDDHKVSIPVVLTGKVDDYEKKYEHTITKDEKGEYNYIFKNLPKKNSDGKEIKYEVTVDGEDDGKVTLGGEVFFVSHTDNLKDNEWFIINEYNDGSDIQITIRKVWEGTAPTDKNFKLIFEILPENGRAIPVAMTTIDGWKKEIRVKKSESGKPIRYVVREVSESKAFQKLDISEEDRSTTGKDKKIIFTNKRVEMPLVLEKKWVGREGEEAEFTLVGKDTEEIIKLSKENSKENSWKIEKNLPVYDLDGKPIKYEISEKEINGYKAVDTKRTFTLVDTAENPTSAAVIFTNTEIIEGGNVVPVIPSTPVIPETTPVVPETTPVVPGTTPTVTIPDDNTPQGDANISNGNTETPSTTEDTNNNEDEDVLAIDEDEVPEGDAKIKDDTSKDAPVDVEADPTPQGKANLPKTGGTVGGYLSILGIGIVGLGLVLRKRK